MEGFASDHNTLVRIAYNCGGGLGRGPDDVLFDLMGTIGDTTCVLQQSRGETQGTRWCVVWSHGHWASCIEQDLDSESILGERTTVYQNVCIRVNTVMGHCYWSIKSDDVPTGHARFIHRVVRMVWDLQQDLGPNISHNVTHLCGWDKLQILLSHTVC